MISLGADMDGLLVGALRTEVGWNELELIGFFEKAGFAPVPRLVLELDVSDSGNRPTGDLELRSDEGCRRRP